MRTSSGINSWMLLRVIAGAAQGEVAQIHYAWSTGFQIEQLDGALFADEFEIGSKARSSEPVQ